VEAVLARRRTRGVPQFGDVVALASLVVSVATLAWTVYNDLRERAAKPAAEVVRRTVRVRLREDGQDGVPDRVIEVVVDETIAAAGEGAAIED
jgi:urease gamma subunit